ncbi:hypothetical protein OSB04_020875 [Centaurea solstitialis]|uniref:Uncharacterized protein n=1 Tax=Centaurea solstitialis TaxID=347529 RepID=A0AA38W4C4_9ASTR|nr:hypothetical protein OSB04_020875 [Centaurea solstitialis]
MDSGKCRSLTPMELKPPAADVLMGVFVFELSSQGALLEIPLHNLFLHSALVLSRKIPNSVHGINIRCLQILFDREWYCSLCSILDQCLDGWLFLALFARPKTYQRTNWIVANVLGKSNSTLYAIALLASGQSSTITCTYVGQYFMQHFSFEPNTSHNCYYIQGFLDLKMRKWLRNLITRCIAITPSLIVSIIGGSSGAGTLIIIVLVCIYFSQFRYELSFELPFALIPLLKFSTSATKLGPHKNSMIVRIGLIVINIYYLMIALVHWLIHSSLLKVGNVLIGIRPFAAHPTRWLRLAIGFIGYTAVDDWIGLRVYHCVWIGLVWCSPRWPSIFSRSSTLCFLKTLWSHLSTPNIDLNYIMEGGNNSIDRRP